MRKFIYGPGIDEPICIVDVADSNAIYYYHFDGLGSVVALSDVNNVIVERYSYDVFGAPTVYDANNSEISKSVVGNPYMFTARRADDETALYYCRARYYAFDIGRFLQTDPMGYFDSLNLYTYCGNDPLNWIDPWGLCEEISEAGQDPFGFIRDKQVRKRFQDYVEWEKYKDGFPPDYHHEKETLKEKFKKWLEDQEPRGHKTKQNKPWRRVKDIKNKITTTTVGVIAEVLAVLPSDEALYTTGTVSRYVGYGAGAAAGAIVIGPAIVAGGAAAVEAARNVIQNPDLVPVLP